MPWTLYRYILREVLKLLVLSTVVMVTVISFAAAIRPLSDGVLGPIALMKFIGYTTPTMLGFALPFAGAFSATLVFLRLASDNEITACSASGISYASILLPVMLLGAVLTMGLFFTSNFVMPWFYREAARIVETDLMSVLVNQLDQGQPYVIEEEGVVLYADRAEQHEVTQDLIDRIDSSIPPENLIALQGVALGILDDTGRLRSDVTARQANMLVFRDPQTEASWVTIKLINAMYYDDARGTLVSMEEYVPPTIRIPSPFKDQVEFLSWPQLEELRKNPDLYDDVREKTRELVDAVVSELLLQKVQQKLETRDAPVMTLNGPNPGERYLVQASKITREASELRLLSGKGHPVMIAREVDGQVMRQFASSWVTMQVDDSGFGDEPTLLVELYETRVWDPRRPGATTELPAHTLPRMVWPISLLDVPRDQYRSWDIREESKKRRYREIAGIASANNPVIRARKRLRAEMNSLDRNIYAQFHNRAASAIACTLLLLLGAVLSMQLKGQMPLIVFFWSFMLAVVSLVIIYTGTNMVHDDDHALAKCLGILWSSNVILASVVGAVYCRIARN